MPRELSEYTQAPGVNHYMLIFCEEVTCAGTQVLNGLGGACLDGGVHCSYTSGPVRVRDFSVNSVGHIPHFKDSALLGLGLNSLVRVGS